MVARIAASIVAIGDQQRIEEKQLMQSIKPSCRQKTLDRKDSNKIKLNKKGSLSAFKLLIISIASPEFLS